MPQFAACIHRRRIVRWLPSSPPGHPAEGLAFAEFISSAPVMPVESSPLNGQSLAAIVKGLGGSAFLVAAKDDPMLAIKGGLGLGGFMIIVGTSEAVMTGLNYRIKRWFGVPEDK